MSINNVRPLKAIERTVKLVRDAMADKAGSLRMASLSDMDTWVSALDGALRDLRMLVTSGQEKNAKQASDSGQS